MLQQTREAFRALACNLDSDSELTTKWNTDMRIYCWRETADTAEENDWDHVDRCFNFVMVTFRHIV